MADKNLQAQVWGANDLDKLLVARAAAEAVRNDLAGDHAVPTVNTDVLDLDLNGLPWGIGSRILATDGNLYLCASPAAGAAQWVRIPQLTASVNGIFDLLVGESFRLATSDAEAVIRMARGTTTDATANVPIEAVGLQEGQRLYLIAFVLASQTNGGPPPPGKAVYGVAAPFHRDPAGAVTQSVADVVFISAETDAAWDCQLNAHGASQTARVEVTGAAGADITWTSLTMFIVI